MQEMRVIEKYPLQGRFVYLSSHVASPGSPYKMEKRDYLVRKAQKFIKIYLQKKKRYQNIRLMNQSFLHISFCWLELGC
jgi:hypothetical protein